MHYTHHKNIRLAPGNYTGHGWYFVTMCTSRRAAYFRNSKIAQWLLAMLPVECTRHSFLPRAYCVMPDHVHLLLQAIRLKADLLRFLDAFKHKTTFRFHTRTGKTLWQTSFYDHILRCTDSPDAVAWYIWSNPVRAGLAEKPFDYPYCGPPQSEWRSSPPENLWSPPNRKLDTPT